MTKILHASLLMFLWLRVIALVALVSPITLAVSNRYFRLPLREEKQTMSTAMILNRETESNSYNGSSNNSNSTTANSDIILRGGSMSFIMPHHDAPPRGVIIRLQRKYVQESLLGEIMVGTPRKKYLVDFDTGSSALWLFGKKAKTSLRLAAELASPSVKDITDPEYKHTYYRSSRSTSSKSVYISDSGTKRLAPPFQVEYDDGDLFKGRYTSDTLQLGNSLDVENVVVGVAERLESISGLTAFDGVFGLGLHPPEDCDLTPPVAQLMASNNFNEENEELFSYYISEGRLNGEFLLGGINSNRFTGAVTYAPLLLLPLEEETCWWTVAVDSVKYQDMMIDKDTRACVDTGTSDVVTPPHVFESLLSEISFHLKLDLYLSQEGIYYFDGPCSFSNRRIKRLPGINFNINGEDYSLKAQYYFITMRGKCVLRLYPSEDEDSWILGEPFLEAFYTIYDIGNKRVGFAKAKHTKEEDTRRVG